MKVMKWIVIGLGTLFLLWICGILVKIVGILLAILGAVLSGITSAIFSKAFWVIALTALIVYLVVRNKGGRSNKTAKPSEGPVDTHFRKVGDLDRRLDRLNDILSRHQ